MRKPGESVYCLSFWRNKFQGKSGDEPYFDVAEDGISAGKVMRIVAVCPAGDRTVFAGSMELAEK